jgi:hypothetical protein
VKEEMDSNSYGRINNVQNSLRATKHDLAKKIGNLHYSVTVFLLCHYVRDKILITLYEFLTVNVRRGFWVRISVTTLTEQKGCNINRTEEIKGKYEQIILPCRALIEKKNSSNSIENFLLISYRFL